MSETAQAPRRKALAIAIEVTFALAFSNSALATTYFVSNTNDMGPGSLRQAIASANASAGQPAIVQFQGGVTGTITLTTGEIAITQPIQVQGPGKGVVTVSGGGTQRIFSVQSASTLPTIVSGLTLQNGYSATTGGAVYVSASHFTMTDCLVQNSVADTSGGGIGSTALSYITLTDDIFDNNLSAKGCGFNLVAKQSTLTGVVSQNNTCTSVGGGGEIQGSATITSSHFLNNTGGGLYALLGPLSVSDSEFSGNYTTRYGGGIGVSKLSGVTISNSTISGNYAGLGGGGISVINAQGTIVVKHSTIDGNKVKVNVGSKGSGNGGGLFLKDGGTTNTLDIGYSTISNNHAPNGGGLFVSAATAYDVLTSLYDTTIAGNVAAYGFGGANIATGSPGSSLTVESTTIAANSASKIGGISVRGTATFHDSIVANNIVPASAPSPDISGTITANFTLVGNTTDATITGANNLLNVDPMLGPLGDYGGGIATMRPNAGSPVIDAGDPAYDTSTSPAHDERGEGRVSGTAIDMGAVEIQPLEDTIFLDGFESG